VLSRVSAAESNHSDSSREKERQPIAIIQSTAPPQDKAIPCKQLAVYGTKDAVPALAALLSNDELASWARIALEAIPDDAADAALRQAMAKLHGKLLVGVINSIGYRRDSQAVGGLVRKLADGDSEVASAAAVALGHIGGPKAAKALTAALDSPTIIRPAVAEGCVLCAEKFLLAGKAAQAAKLYDTIRQSDVAKQRVLEATRGAILARGRDGLPLLLEQLRSADKAFLGIGLHTARELPGREVTEALANELQRASDDRQSYLLLALADRPDDVVLPAILAAARNGKPKLRLAAVRVLDRMGNISSLPVLLEAAADPQPDLAQAALTALARLPGNGVDMDLMARLPKATGKNRQVLIQLAGQRRIEAALPSLVQSASDSEPAIRSASIQSLGLLGTERQVTDLAGLLPKTQTAKEREEIEMSLIAIAGRRGAASVSQLRPLTESADSNLRIIGLHGLASAGGNDALVTVKRAVDDKDEAVQDEAVRTLATWPNNWPEDAAVAEPLLALAQTAKKESHQMLGLRGFLQYLKADKKLSEDEKVSKINELLPLLKRAEEKRLAIAALENPTGNVFTLLMSFANDPDIADDASLALIGFADKDRKGVSKEQRQKALETVLEKSRNEETKKKAETMLKGS